MENLLIPGTETTPQISFRKDSGILAIEGKSLADNVKAFYEPAHAWLTAYSKQPASQTELSIKLEYLNTETSRYFLDIFSILTAIPNSKVVWNFSDEDEDMEEMGQELAELCPVPFELRSY